MKHHLFQPIRCLLLLLVTTCSFFSPSFAEDSKKTETPLLHEKPSEAPDKIDIKPTTSDEEIAKRLESILKATGWFINPEVHVENGVVFFTGKTQQLQFKDWATNLAHNTQDVAAVVNRIVVLEPSIWNSHIILSELFNQTKKIARAIPGILLGCAILFIFWLLAKLVYKLMHHVYRDKVNPSVLREVVARGISFLVFLIGIYFIFEMAELTTMALTILSGTGIIGLILGIAFRDITENFLASILLSIQNPFHGGDLIDIMPQGTNYVITGYVERLTLRVTILIGLDGNHLQIPNATVYKSNIRNYSSNPNRRDDFSLSIGINYSISEAEKAAQKVLTTHEAVLKNPEPLVLLENLTHDLANLRVYYWFDSQKYNSLKVKSSLLRLVKQSFQEKGIEFPLPEGALDTDIKVEKEATKTRSESESKHDSQKMENKGTAPQARPPEQGKNLLDPNQNKRKKSKEEPPKDS